MSEKPTYEELEKRVLDLENAELDLKKEEEKLRDEIYWRRLLVAESIDGIVVLDQNSKVYEANKRFADMLGYSMEELHLLHAWDWDAQFTMAQILEMIQEVDGAGHQFETRHRRKDGTLIYVELSNNGIVYKGQKLVFCVCRDITDRKQAEEILQNEKNRLQSIFDAIEDGLTLQDKAFNILFQNKAVRDLSGGIGGKCYEVYEGSGTICEGCPVEAAFKNGESQIAERETVSQSGEIMCWENTANPIRDSRGEIVACLEIIRNINARKQAEEAIQRSEEKYRQLSNLLPQVVFETDEKGTLTFVNHAAFDIFGYTEEDFKKGLNVLQMFTPEDRDMAGENIQKIMGGERSAGKEYTALRKDFSTYPALMYSNPILSEGRTIGLRGIIADLTEFKCTQEALRESEEKIARLKKMEALGLLAGGVAHDLNNILSGIVSYPELILMDLTDDSKLKKPIETIHESGQRAAAIVQDLLTVARGVAMNKEPLDMNALIRAYLTSPEFEKLKQFHPSVTVKTNLDSDLLNIKGSRVHVRKVIMNLVSNASEAIEGSGNVIISTMNRYVDKPLRGYDDVSTGEYVILSVSDDGSGISSGDLERIFDPFYTKKVMGRSGTGLGLSVVWNVVQDHEGYLDVITDEKGTTFELYFPITRDEVGAQASDVSINDLKGNGELILVVDDEERQREISCKMLDALEYKTFAFSSGEKAIEYLKEHKADLILLDMIMDPGKNGRETYEGIIKIHPNQKAVIVSGFAETVEVKKTQKLGAGQYLKKPLTLKGVGVAVKEELKK